MLRQPELHQRDGLRAPPRLPELHAGLPALHGREGEPRSDRREASLVHELDVRVTVTPSLGMTSYTWRLSE